MGSPANPVKSAGGRRGGAQNRRQGKEDFGVVIPVVHGCMSNDPVIP